MEVREGRSKKTKEGFLYSAKYTQYTKDVLIYAEVNGIPIERSKMVVKMGGEGRLALMKVLDGAPMFDRLKENFKEGRGGPFALYLATPALFDAGRNPDIEKELERLTNLKMLYSNYRTGVLGGGYSVRLGRRKPLYMKLLSGSVFFVEGEPDIEKLWWNCGLGKAWEIGYGTLIPIPI